MEFRCEGCEHVGTAKSVVPRGGSFVLICENCGHENRLEIAGDGVSDRPQAERERSDEADGRVEKDEFDVERARAVIGPVKKPDVAEEMAKFRDEAMARLVPEPGPGPRCPKYVHLLDPLNDFCGRCGLNVAEAVRYETGEAPWEKPPPDKEGVWEQAQLLWASLEDDWSEEKFQNFANFVREERLLELATRKIKWRLVEEPEDAVARELLAEIAEELQSRIMVAQARAKANVEQFSDVTQRAKSAILWTTLTMWLIILMVLVIGYMC